MRVDIERSSENDLVCETCFVHEDVLFVLDIGSDVLHICRYCLITLRNELDPLRLLITTGIDTKDKKED